MDHSTENLILTLENDNVFYNNRPTTFKYWDVLYGDTASQRRSKAWLQKSCSYDSSQEMPGANYIEVLSHFLNLWAEEINDSLEPAKEDPYSENLKEEISTLSPSAVEHFKKVSDELFAINSTTETDMSTQPLYEQRHYLKGVDMNTLSDDEVIAKISEIEDEIKRLSKIKTKSTKITEQLKTLDKALEDVVTVLDAR